MAEAAGVERDGRQDGPANGSAAGDGARLTVDELGRQVGMSPRTIRAHQARKLLAPPVRHGRTAYYHNGHVQRLEVIKGLQRQGFNLVAIEAILGTRAADQGSDTVTRAVTRVAAEHPHLVYGLTRHGVVVRLSDHTLRSVRPRLLRSALDLHQAGVPPRFSLQVLVEVLDRVRQLADDLVLTAGARIMALAPEAVFAEGRSWDEMDGIAVALTQALASLLTEAFRVSVERSGQTLLPDLVADRTDVDLRLRETDRIDTG
jgi:DNA-binding transcriptional MerR regulator